jgi:ABC-type Na+ transport system ATPase subunit NatA
MLKNEGKSWTEFYKYVKWSKGNREDIAVVKDGNGQLITDLTEKVNSKFLLSVFSCAHSILQIQCANLCKPFSISTKILTKRLAVTGKNKSVQPDRISGKF